jgi:hypothetical protein
MNAVRPGEGKEIRSLTLVLEGNNPRFPRKPSTTMLTYRLAGTTENFGVDRNEHPTASSASGTVARTPPTPKPPRNLREPRRALERALSC